MPEQFVPVFPSCSRLPKEMVLMGPPGMAILEPMFTLTGILTTEVGASSA